MLYQTSFITIRNSPHNINTPSLNNKETWLAVILSTILAGIGQIYPGNVVKGWFFILSQVLLYSFGFGLIFSSNGDTAVVMLLRVVMAILNIWRVFDAYKSAVDKNTPSL